MQYTPLLRAVDRRQADVEVAWLRVGLCPRIVAHGYLERIVLSLSVAVSNLPGSVTGSNACITVMITLFSGEVPWDVFFTRLAEEWILGLDDADYEAIMAAIELLEEKGPTLGRPAVDRVSGSPIPVADELYDEHLRQEGLN